MTDDALVTDKQIFEILRNYQAIKIPEEDLIISASHDIDYNEVRIIVEQLVLAVMMGTKSSTVYHSYDVPNSTWQMFKSRHYNSWWLRWFVNRHPVRYDTHVDHTPVEVTSYMTYPEAQYNLVNSRLGRPIQLDILKEL